MIREGCPKLIPALALSLVVLLLTACNPAASSTAGGLIGSAAPTLTGKDVTGTGITDLAQLKGKPTVVVFWLNTCPHCQNELPQVEAAWPTLGVDANILTVGMLNPDFPGQPPYETVQAFVKTTGLTLPTIEYKAADAVENWALEGVPAIFVLDKDHIVQALYLGEGHIPEVQAALQALARN